MAENGVIGHDGDIPWSIPEDLKHFRAVTRDNTVVMGRRTFESIGHPLPVPQQRSWSPATPSGPTTGCFVAHDIDEAIALAQDFDGDVMVIGGAQVYAAAMDRATHQVLTEVHQSPHGDTTYPDWDRADVGRDRAGAPRGFDFVWWQRA